MAIPPGAVYVSEDGLVTFDQYGRKLDSLGNVAWDDTQGAWGANAKPIERPQQQMQQQPQTQQAATPVVKAATGAYSPSVSATPQAGAAAQQRPPTQASPSQQQPSAPSFLPQGFQPWNQPQAGGGNQAPMQRPPQNVGAPSVQRPPNMPPPQPMGAPGRPQPYDAGGSQQFMPMAMAPGSSQFQPPPYAASPSYQVPTNDYIMPSTMAGRTYPVPPPTLDDYRESIYYQPPWVPNQFEYPADTYTPSTPGMGWGPKW